MPGPHFRLYTDAERRSVGNRYSGCPRSCRRSRLAPWIASSASQADNGDVLANTAQVAENAYFEGQRSPLGARTHSSLRAKASCEFRDPRAESHLTCDVWRERAAGIEPAFSAWEAHRGVLRDLRISGKVQFNPFRTDPLVFAIAPCLSLRVARNGSHAACCTLLHGDGRGSQPCKLSTPEDASASAKADQRRGAMDSTSESARTSIPPLRFTSSTKASSAA